MTRLRPPPAVRGYGGQARDGARREDSAEVVRLDAARRAGVRPFPPGRPALGVSPDAADTFRICARIRRWGPMLDFVGLLVLAGLLAGAAVWLRTGAGV